MNTSLAPGLAALVGGIAGFLGMRFGVLGSKFLEIRISRQGDRCVSTTYPYTLHARKLQSPHWDIYDPDGCLGEAAVELRFNNDDSPLFKQRPRSKTENNKRTIRDIITLGARKETYKYEVWYVSDTESYRMEDPEIQIEY
jgi:hypothetical protein